ncbi:CAP domain-containing protein [Sphaerisporangium rufum]|nr:CAP domain-containing protein [Sphaerisporangium rufum]
MHVGLLACLATAALVAAMLAHRSGAGVDQVHLSRATPSTGPSRILAAAEPTAEPTAGAEPGTGPRRRPPLGHVAHPEIRVTGEARPRGTAPGRASRPPSAIDGSGSSVAPGTSVGAAGGGEQGGRGEQQAPAGSAATRSLEAAAARLTNRVRARQGCAPLRVDTRLTASARAHSADMARRGYFGHTAPGGRSPWDRMARAGYTNSAAENIARGYQTAQEAVDGWMADPGHRRNILNCQIVAMGIGVAEGAGDIWWTQDFGYS